MKHEIEGIKLKKVYGQNFLRDQSIVDTMLNAVNLGGESHVFEIGCGDGFLTGSILKKGVEHLWVFEIDKSWADYVSKKFYNNNALKIINTDILSVDFSIFNQLKPWILLANLPYQITFPFIYKLIGYNSIEKDFLKEGVLMIQEEVAQKIVQKSGRGYGFNSLYLQHFFDWELLTKVTPNAFYPAPKVYSRLIYFKPKDKLDVIINEEGFWIFIKRIFSQPRRTLKNNLKSYHYNLSNLPENILSLRAQQLGKDQLVHLWELINKEP